MKPSTSPQFNPLNGLTAVFITTLIIHIISLISLGIYDVAFLILLMDKTLVRLEDFGRVYPYTAVSLLLVYGFYVLTYLFLIILFPTWFYKAYKNLAPLKALAISYKPLSPLYCWFIPILCWFRPFQLAKEMWIESDPDFDPELNFLSLTSKAATFIWGWWLFYVSAAIWSMYVIIFPKLYGTQSKDYKVILLTELIMFALICPSTFCAIMMVKKIANRQRERFERIMNYQAC